MHSRSIIKLHTHVYHRLHILYTFASTSTRHCCLMLLVWNCHMRQSGIRKSSPPALDNMLLRAASTAAKTKELSKLKQCRLYLPISQSPRQRHFNTPLVYAMRSNASSLATNSPVTMRGAVLPTKAFTTCARLRTPAATELATCGSVGAWVRKHCES